MAQILDQLCSTLAEMLYRIEHRVHSVRAKIEGNRAFTDAAVARQLEEAREAVARITDDAEAACTRMKTYRPATKDTVARWKRETNLPHLQRRAEQAEAYAAWSVMVAAKAIDDAGLAALEALAAWKDLENASKEEPSGPSPDHIERRS